MAVDVKDLPPAYQAQAFRKLAEQEQKKKRRPLPCPAGDGTGERNKYHNQTTERVTAAGGVLRFDSQKEARRYDRLAALERAGEIRDLRKPTRTPKGGGCGQSGTGRILHTKSW